MKLFFMILFGIIVSTIYTNKIVGQSKSDDCFCCSDKHKQFDCWIGNRNMYDTLGNLVGENEIKSNQDPCVIQENWKSKSGTGTSSSLIIKVVQ